MTAYIFQDWSANGANPTKGKYIVVLYRLAQYLKRSRITFILFFWYFLLYRVVVEWFMCVELSWNTKIGTGFQIYHGSGLVIHPNSIIGVNCKIRQCTTLGVKQDSSYGFNETCKAPRIGDNVDIGCNSLILGDISIGDNAVIGAGTVVVKNVPMNAVMVGNPCRIIKTKSAIPKE